MKQQFGGLVKRGNVKCATCGNPAIAWLQWSHVHSNVETRSQKSGVRSQNDGRSFNGATFIQTWKLGQAKGETASQIASMEPRSFKRGNMMRAGVTSV